MPLVVQRKTVNRLRWTHMVGDVIVFDTGGYSSIVVSTTGSVGTYSCDVIGNNTGHDAELGEGETINSVSLTSSDTAISFGSPPRFIWITCSANSGTVTAVIFGRK